MSNERKLTVCDSETDPFLFGRMPEPFLWGWYDGENYEQFADTGEFVRYVRDVPQVCYCHNGGKFDFFFLADWIDHLQPITIINGRLTKFKIGECEFRDSWNILPLALRKFGEKKEIEYWKLERSVRAEHMREIEEYLYVDCFELYRAVRRYRDDYGNNLTVAGGAMKFWSKLTDTAPPKTVRSFYQEFSPYYYGGRVECLARGIIEKPFTSYDINSAYPRAMLEPHAWETIYKAGEHIPASQAELQRSFITLRAESHGALPWRAENGSLQFPRDGAVREFHVTGWEFQAARDTGTLVLDDVLAVYTFLHSIDFRPYVEHFFALKALAKETGDRLGYENAKLHLNSLYGKFGANPDKYEEFITAHPADVNVLAETRGYDLADYFGPHAIMCRPISDGRKHFYNVATAASITGFQRAQLWRAMCQCSNVLYVDTDNIKSERFGVADIGDAVGQWSLEHSCDYGAFAGKKLYATRSTSGKWRVASKGAKLTHDDIIEIARGGTIHYARDVPSFSIKSGTRFLARDIKMTV